MTKNWLDLALKRNRIDIPMQPSPFRSIGMKGPTMKAVLTSLAVAALLACTQAAVAQDVAAGKKLFTDNCAPCHGAMGQGGMGKKLAGDAAYWDFPIFQRTVMTGVDDEGKQMQNMPVFGTTGFMDPKGVTPTDTDLKNIQAYLKTFGPPE
jgi:cytochrome c